MNITDWNYDLIYFMNNTYFLDEYAQVCSECSESNNCLYLDSVVNFLKNEIIDLTSMV